MASAWVRKMIGGLPSLDTVYVECAGICNLDCRFCFSRTAEDPLGLMKRETFAAVARSLFPYAYAVNFVGYGEPLLNRHLPWMIRTARSYGRETHLTTNGILMDEEKICALIAAGADSIAVSLDGASAPVHDANRGAGSFATTTRNMDILRKVKDKMGLARPALTVDTILTRSNRGEIGALLEVARALDARGVNLAHLQVCDEADAGESLLDEKAGIAEEYRAWREKARVLGMRLRLPDEFGDCTGRGCFWDPGRRLAVAWNGEVRPCCSLLHPNRWHRGGKRLAVAPPSLGNLTKRSFPAIWRGEEYARFREAVARGRWPEACSPCLLRGQ
jgi:MoaA/NifB/PqqE/SkfB family radical SAM enzyme